MPASGPEILRIDPVEVPGVTGRLGLCACPGARREPGADPSALDRLAGDVRAFREFGACGVVTLVDDPELALLGLASLPELLRDAGMWWRHLPIQDMGVPGPLFETRWSQEGPHIHRALARGGHVVLHCWAGLGRTGTVAARVLIECGLDPDAALLRVRTARPGAVQTRKQEKYVLKLRAPPR